MSACAGVIQTVGTFGWWAGHFSHQNGGDVVYFKDMHNQTRVGEMGEVVSDEDYFPPEWIGIVAPSLDRHGKLVQKLIGDVLVKEPKRPVL